MAIAAMWCVSCSKDDDDKDPLNGEGGEGVITMVAKTNRIEGVYVYSFKEGETITIDWGDGTIEEFKTYAYYDMYDVYYQIDTGHSYSNNTPHTIKIKGSIKELSCYYNNLTSLDVSGCTALTYLGCPYNTYLTSLDVS
ncbi:MAG: hypothetical protein K2O69_03170, partial [Odoribacter sp.]|nr:hypothetical protein [Odoribacter sp.]